MATPTRHQPTRRTRAANLEGLDTAITRFRRFLQLPAVGDFIHRRLDRDVDLNVYRVLRAVETSEGEGRTVGDVAQILDVEASTASRLIDGAVAASLLLKQSSELDRRCTLVHLTDQGAEWLQQLRQARIALWSTITSEFTKDEIGALASLLDRIYDAAKGLDE